MILVERMMDDGYDVVQLPLPALLTVVKDINEPRVPSLKGQNESQKSGNRNPECGRHQADEKCIGLAGSPTQVVNVFTPPPRGDRTVFSGTPEEQVRQLVEQLKNYL